MNMLKEVTNLGKHYSRFLLLVVVGALMHAAANAASLVVTPSGQSIVVCIGEEVTVSATLSGVDPEKTATVTVSGDGGSATETGVGTVSTSHSEMHTTPTMSVITASGTDAVSQSVTVYWIGINVVDVDDGDICPGQGVTATAHTSPIDGQPVCETRWSPCEGPCDPVGSGYQSGGLTKSFSSSFTESICGDPATSTTGCGLTITATSVNGSASSSGSCTVNVGAWGAWEIVTDPTITIVASANSPQCVNCRRAGDNGFLSDPTTITATATTNASNGTRRRANGCGGFYGPVPWKFDSLIFNWTAAGAGAVPLSGDGNSASTKPNEIGACVVSFNGIGTLSEPYAEVTASDSKAIVVFRNNQSQPIFTAPANGQPPGPSFSANYKTPRVPWYVSGVYQGDNWTEYNGNFTGVVLNQEWETLGDYTTSGCGSALSMATVEGLSVVFTIGLTVGNVEFTVEMTPPQTSYTFFGPAESPPADHQRWFGQVYREKVSLAGGTFTGQRRNMAFSLALGEVAGAWETISGLNVSFPANTPQPRGANSAKSNQDCCP